MSFRAVAVLIACTAVSACGFRPLYGDFAQGSSGAKFLNVEIGITKDRSGQLLRNELIRLLYGGRPALKPEYRLVMELIENKTSLAVKKSAFATRGNLTMVGQYWLFDVSTGAEALAGSSEVTVSYNILDSEFASLLGEKNARNRAIKELGHDIRVRLGGFFDRHGKERS